MKILFYLITLEKKLFKNHNFNFFNLSEFEITDTELNAIANAANIGLSQPIAANGIPTVL